jgi:hypothetical protein
MRRFLLLPLVGLLMLALTVPTVFAGQHTGGAPNQTGGLLSGIPLTGTLEGEPFTGTLNITEITREAGTRNLLVTGDVLDAAGNVIATLTAGGSTLTGPNGTGPNASCQILYLTLGPIFLDLLGLVVEVPDPIIIDIRAEPGPGALLGNLLCALVGLLDGGAFAAIDRLLGQINRLL